MLATDGKFNETTSQRRQGCVSSQGRAGRRAGEPHTELSLLKARCRSGELQWSREVCNGLGCLVPKWPQVASSQREREREEIKRSVSSLALLLGGQFS